MKTSPLLLALVCGITAPIFAQNAIPQPATPITGGALRSEADLDQLLGPIALYPDAIIALILPASTVPGDVVLAARQMRGTNNDHSQVELRAWDDSVKSLTFYPDVLKWLDDNLEWTTELGQAFLAQPADVMNAIQRLRARARAAGTLVDSPQQQVLVTPNVIRIVPAQPDLIYVPYYEPSVVYYPTYYSIPSFYWGAGYPVGSWLAFDCDWVHRKIWVGDRHRHWQGQDWHRPVVSPDRPSTGGTLVRDWRPSRAAVDRANFVGPMPLPAQRNTPSPGQNLPRSSPLVRDFNRTRPATPSANGIPANVASAPLTAVPSAANSAPLISGMGRPSFVGPMPQAAQTVAASPGRSFPSASRGSRDFNGPRPAPASSNLTPAPVATAMPLPPAAPGIHTQDRSLPNVIGRSQLPVAPPVPAAIAPLPSAREARAFVGPPAPTANLNVAPPLPAVAPPLPAVVPNFAQPAAPSTNIAPAPDRSAPANHRTGHRGNQD